MEIKGEYKIAAPREKVFAALNDPAVLQACIPGCESLEKTSDTEMKAKVRMRIGPVSAAFSGKVTLSDLDPPNGYRISGEGQGGAAGFAKGGAVVALKEDGSDTVLTYNVDAQVGGKIAQVGARLIDGTAKKLADEFFSKFAAMVGGPPAAEAAAAAPATAPGASAETVQMSAPAAAPAAATAAASSAAAQRGYRHWMIIGIGAVVLVLVYLASR
ncbi:MAG: carbon monoxide dehydrogenase [Alphaproteobacteria bacterium 65-37]|jgi:carbon monoxide dehydrogenase subunit G|nr:carbon monoxide dehydrogenase subunit G [Alphaproteobacteria bacterium]OJU46201.1 MAG: carbon monoxide dehydrogenase [Alphaproteobacteria bacterium 65-37]